MDSIGHYRIVRQIAEGGMSTVYEAIDSRLDRRVAIKVARPTSDPAEHARVVERFQQEANLSRALLHHAIVSVFDLGTLPDGTPYIVSEWVEGHSLEQILRQQGRIPLPMALSIAERVAGALGAAHALGFTHSDVKPANILIQDRGSSPEVKLLDFGVAGKLTQETGLTRSGSLIGTFYYMSPEQIRAGGLSPSSDVWALGVVLFEMLTGSKPFDGEGVVSIVSEIVTAQVKIPSDANIPAPVAAFLMRCLDRDPARRPANGDEAAREIRQLQSELSASSLFPGYAPPPAPVSAPAAPSAASSGAAMPFPRVSPPSPRPRPAAASAPPPTLAPRLFLSAAGVVVLSAILFVVVHYARFAPRPWTGVLFGMALALAGFLLGRAIQKTLAARHREISNEVQDVLHGARSQRQLSQTLAIQVDELLSKCRLVDEKILATTMAVMVEEFSVAKAFDDRQKALMNAVTLLDKLMPRLSPWYVRHDKLIGFAVTLVGILSGLVTVAQNLLKIFKG